MNRPSLFASLAASLGLAVAILAAASPAGADPRPIDPLQGPGGPQDNLLFIPPIACGEMFQGQVFHMDKIAFRSVPASIFICPPGTIDPANAGPLIINSNSLMDIKVLDDPSLIADIKEKVADFLNALGCLNGAGIGVVSGQVDVVDVEYATACGLDVPPPLGN